MRRKDKEIKNTQKITEILSNNYICRLGLSLNDKPYIIPMNYGYFENAIYFHSSKEGKKIEIIKHNPNVCFEITEGINVINSIHACDFGTKYKSVFGNGKIEILFEEYEKINALNIIMKQHTQKNDWHYSKKALEKIVILRLNINKLTGKISG